MPFLENNQRRGSSAVFYSFYATTTIRGRSVTSCFLSHHHSFGLRWGRRPTFEGGACILQRLGIVIVHGFSLHFFLSLFFSRQTGFLKKSRRTGCSVLNTWPVYTSLYLLAPLASKFQWKKTTKEAKCVLKPSMSRLIESVSGSRIVKRFIATSNPTTWEYIINYTSNLEGCVQNRRVVFWRRFSSCLIVFAAGLSVCQGCSLCNSCGCSGNAESAGMTRNTEQPKRLHSAREKKGTRSQNNLSHKTV